jgi:hypothetical protein
MLLYHFLLVIYCTYYYLCTRYELVNVIYETPRVHRIPDWLVDEFMQLTSSRMQTFK